LERVALEDLKETNTPGAVVAIVSGDRMVFAKSFGIANSETGSPVTPDMLFRTASAGKMLTAAVLTLLAEEGKLRLDEPVGRYVKGLSPKLSQVTAHQLLTHTAGLKDEVRFSGAYDESALGQTARTWTDDLFFLEPGKILSYSNVGYSLAGLLIEEVGGKPYAAVMNERLFKPLGMSRTTFSPTMAMTFPLSQGHGSDPEKVDVIRPFADNAVFRPSGFEFTTVQDMTRFAIALLNGGKVEGRQVLPQAVVTRLTTPYVPMHSHPNPVSMQNGMYGYGLMIHVERGVHVVEHTGVIPGFGCRFLIVPEHRFAVVVMTNRTGATLNKTVEKAMELMLPLKPKAEGTSKQEIPMSEAEMNNYAGTYYSPSNTADIFIRDGKLFEAVS
jgi:CubicO group peptidase (beta-lactamase class C family)